MLADFLLALGAKPNRYQGALTQKALRIVLIIRKADRAVGIRGRACPRCAAGRGYRHGGLSAGRRRRRSGEAQERGLLRSPPVWRGSGAGLLGQEVVRHLLNRGGNRDVTIGRCTCSGARTDELGRTHPREYVARRTAEGKSKREILRCLKRYVAREVYRILTAPGALPSSVSVP